MRRCHFVFALALGLAPAVACAEKAADRPKGAAKCEVVANVLLTKGKPLGIDEQKVSFALTDAVGLCAADTVSVPVGGVVALQLLQNGYVVRLDDDLELKVADIALLGAPKAKVSLNDQLAKVLTQTERQELKGERLVGWYVSPTAANVPGLLPETERRKTSEPTRKAEKSFAADDEVARPPAKAAAREERKADTTPPASPRSEESDARRPMPKDTALPESEPPTDRPVPKDAPKPAPPRQVASETATPRPAPPPPPTEEPRPPPPPSPSPAAVTPAAPDPLALLRAQAQGDASLRQCLAAQLDGLGPAVVKRAGGVVRLKVKRVGAAVVVRLLNGLQAPPCAVAYFTARADALPADGTAVELSVPVK